METISLTILKATSGHKLVNRVLKMIAFEAQLAPKADSAEWEEITEDEAAKLQAEWDEQSIPDPAEQDTTDATPTA